MPARVPVEIRTEIVRLYLEESLSRKELAECFGLSVPTIGNILYERLPHLKQEKSLAPRPLKRSGRISRRVMHNRRLVALRWVSSGLRASSPLRRLKTLEQIEGQLVGKFRQEIALLLSDSSWMVRRQALRVLAPLKDAALKQSFMQMLDDESGWVRLEAVRMLRDHYGDIDLIAPLRRRLACEQIPDVRAEILCTLVQLDLDRSGEILLERLPGEDPEVQLPVLRTLLANHSRHPATWVLLMRTLDNARIEVRRKLLDMLRENSSEEAMHLVRRMFERERSASQRLALAFHILSTYPELHSVLSRALRQDRVLREGLLRHLHRLPFHAKKDLVQLLRIHSLPLFRALAVSLLRRDGRKWAVSLLKDMQDDPHAAVRRRVRTALKALAHACEVSL